MTRINCVWPHNLSPPHHTPMFLIFTKYSGDLEFFQCQKSYLSHPIRHIVNSGHIYNSGQKLRKLPFIGFRVTLHNPKKEILFLTKIEILVTQISKKGNFLCRSH